MQSSKFPKWKFPKSVNIKRALNINTAKHAKRRRIGIVDSECLSTSTEVFRLPKTGFVNDVQLESTIASQEEFNLNSNNFEIMKSNHLLNNIDDEKHTHDQESAASSPTPIKQNGFTVEHSHVNETSKPLKLPFHRRLQKNITNFKVKDKLSFQSSVLPEKEKKSKLKYKLHRRNSSERFTHLGLLTPAFILHPTIHNEHILTKKLTDKLGKDLQLKLAAAHINDAINGRGKFGEARAIFKSYHIQKCFQIISSQWWAGLLYLNIIIHCLMMFWEQPAIPVAVGVRWSPWKVHPAVLAVNAVCLVVYIVDILLHSFFFTWRNIWFAKEALWIRVEVVFTCMFVIDYGILVAEAITELRLVCPFRCLRASMLLCKSKNVSHIFNVLLSIISKLGKVLIIIAIFIVTFASTGLHIFMGHYTNLTEPCTNQTMSGVCTDIYNGAFDNVANAALHMFVLMSTENYPEFIIPAFKESWANFFYFGLFLYAGVFFLTAILLAIIVESYWDYSKRHVKQERRQQREELAKAWNLMDPLGKGQLSINDESLLKLFQILKPKNTADENLELISYISMYGDGLIDSFDWTTKLIEALSFEFEEDMTEERLPENQHFNIFANRFCVLCQKICRFIIHAKAIAIAVLVLIFVHSILFCLMWHGIPDNVQLAIQSTRTAIVGLFCIEILLRVIADGKLLCNVYDILDIAMVLSAAVADVVWYILWFRTPRADAIHLGACVVVSGLSILIRAVFNSKHARTAVRILRNIYPVMFDLILLVMTIIFNFAVVGFEIFQDKTLAASSASGYEGSYVEYDCQVGFETFGCSLLIVFQIVTTNDWQEIMLGAMLDAGWPSAFYFVACYLIVDMIVMNLFVAISIEAYKKLAIDNTALKNNTPENQDQVKHDPKPEEPFTTTARNALEEIFATSRKSKTSTTSNTLTGYTSSPYAVRRGTLGSLGQRTPTPSPRPEKRRTSLRSNASSLSPSVDNIPTATQLSSPPTSDDFKQRSLVRKEIELKKRQQRKKRNRKTKLEEGKPIDESQTGTTLQIDDIVNLKKMVRVIKAYHARGANEMNLKEGEMISVMKKENDMLLGPMGWFPADHVTHDNDRPSSLHGSTANIRQSSMSPKDPNGRVQHRVQFDVSVIERKPRQSPPRPRISQTRMIRKTDGADWRRDIHGDITVMNKDEMQDLSRKIRGGLERRHTSHLRNMPSQLSLKPTEELIEEEEIEPPVPRLTVSEVKPEVTQDEDDEPAVNSDTNTLTLTVPQPHASRRPKSPQKKGDGSMPEWMQKFVTEKQIALDKDVKLDESNSPARGSDDERGVVNVVVHEPKPVIKRKKMSCVSFQQP